MEKMNVKEDTGFSVRPDEVKKEIELCPLKAKNGRVVIMPFVPIKKTESGLYVPERPKIIGNGHQAAKEPAKTDIPMGWVISVGPEVKDAYEPGDLIYYSGYAQTIYVNKKEYLALQGTIDIMCICDHNKVTAYL